MIAQLSSKSFVSTSTRYQKQCFKSCNRPHHQKIKCTSGCKGEVIFDQPQIENSKNTQEVSLSWNVPVAKRELAAWAAGAFAISICNEAQAITNNPLEFKKEVNKRRRKIPVEEFEDGPEGLKYYDIVVGDGQECKVGQRVAIHYDVKWRSITFMTSRQGVGVTGGNPIGFDVGQPAGEAGSTLAGIDLGVRGMKVGGLRRLMVPPNLAYGKRGVGEIPPDATLDVDVELLSIKSSPIGFRTKLVEG